MTMWIKVGVAALAVTLLAAGAFWFWSGSGPAKLANPWYEGAEGYYQAQQQALALGYPLLYVLETPKCRRCKGLNQRFWRSDEMAAPLNRLVKVRLNPGKGDGSEQILRRFPKVATPPGIFIQQPGQPLRPIKIVVDIEQIWMPGKTWRRGYYMPLSAAGFEAVVHTTLALQDPELDNAPLD
ncbi:hypothetical protein EHZ86_00265 [Aeromonas australiensis]|uniref:hypothetical protein n=1 Tax=Aeromonas australiensis TaxID=1114880 RepID=UPI001F176DFF|nr:hypothetical protein [Aeromonas australiensis]MCF3095788.1 hypothetical protein [Aeromonas australiensis]